MIPVLYYHRVGHFRPGAERKMNVTPETFRKHMRYLARRRYRFVSLDQAMSGVRGKCVAVTFDDGYRDCLEYAVPVLHEYAIPATFFIVTDAVGKTDAWYRSEDEILTWTEIADLHKRGYTIGSHSRTHAPLSKIDMPEARREIVDSKKALEDRLGMAVRHFAYPKGLNSPAVQDAVREAGYAAAWATQSGDGTNFARRRFRVPAAVGTLRFGLEILQIRVGYY